MSKNMTTKDLYEDDNFDYEEILFLGSNEWEMTILGNQFEDIDKKYLAVKMVKHSLRIETVCRVIMMLEDLEIPFKEFIDICTINYLNGSSTQKTALYIQNRMLSKKLKEQ